MYPSKANLGGQTAVIGWNVPVGLVPIFEKRGFTKDLTVSNQRLNQEAPVLIAKAQDELKEKLEAFEIEKAEFEKEKQRLAEETEIKKEKKTKSI